MKKAAIALTLLALMWAAAVSALVLAVLLIPLYTSPWAKGVWRALDSLVNAAWFIGMDGETISENAGRLLIREDTQGIKAPRWAHWVDKQTNRIDDNHARDSVRTAK